MDFFVSLISDDVIEKNPSRMANKYYVHIKNRFIEVDQIVELPFAEGLHMFPFACRSH